ncbi:Nramp family divalent metal transporter [Robiginitalea sp. M366]|uniref:Nramp family divalent metal transporter n=1 Tax=Robiginitalea aestuariiviva TaxID=3036903 RepID=UPI00240E1BF8|nr:Nramp family divalent metal transporter [Robiginitalea aestuariiviva]MDG1572831.1 Nramp family divalent metal transporter [Robiginitalea aestuariiviva]
MRKTGPGLLIAAAFIGPGTVTTCLRAGIENGYTLLWALLLSVLATLVLQEMAGRLGLVTRSGIPEILRRRAMRPALRWGALGLILAAVVLGNAAYQAGNVAGAVLGMEALGGSTGYVVYPWLIGGIAGGMLWFGTYKFLEGVFAVLVGLMSLSFLVAAVALGPALPALLEGLFVPRAPGASIWTVLALIGTTVVPYNVFLYASLVNEKWSGAESIPAMRRDIGLSVVLGGLISMGILVAAAASGVTGVSGVMDLASALEPVYGAGARYGLGIGLFAAGISSAITAPLAAAYVAQQCMGWDPMVDRAKFRAVWLGVLLFGVLSLSLEFRPLEVIYFAQIANALLLPLIAAFLWWGVRSGAVMAGYRNTAWQNAFAAGVLLVVTLLALKSILGILQN